MGSMNDPVADLLNRVLNASQAQKRYIDIPWSKLKESLVKILKDQGYLAHFLVKEEKKKGTMRVFLKYGAGREPVIQGLKRISKPSLRRYVSYQKIPPVLGGMGIAIVSTPKGLMEGRQARQEKMGGELVCYAW